jgi:Family of unknown function (DUF6454)
VRNNLQRQPLVLACALAALAGSVGAHVATAVAERVAALTRATKWTRVSATPIAFNTFHPQGLVKIGETLFLSSVEVHDREAGRGVGHLFKLDAGGRKIAELTLGEGSIYHPGGIDFDGHNIWVPVAEYRPDSRSIVYRVDPASMTATEVLRARDHIGAIVRDTDDGSLHGVSWGSRRFYRWPFDRAGKAAEPTRRLNPSHYLDYQDCKYAGGHRMVCTGVTELRTAPGAPPFRLGGIDLIDLHDGRPLHQSPIQLWTPGGLDMTHNPVWLEPTATGLRAYFIPEDERSTIYVYETERS